MKIRRRSWLLLAIMALTLLLPGSVMAVTIQGQTYPFNASLANCLVDKDDSLTIQIPPKAFPKDFTLKVFKKDPAQVKAPSGYYVTKAADISFVSIRGIKEVNSMVPIRLMYTFDEIDYKRASQMDTSQPLGKYRLGYYNEVESRWVILPTIIFWDGQNGMAEATANMGSGEYALFWDPEAQGSSLSPMGGDKLRIFVNYTQVHSTVEPFIEQGRTMVPLGVISQNMGAAVKWFSDEQRIEILSSQGSLVKIWIDNYQGLVDGKEITLPVAPMLVQGKTFVPLSFVGLAVGADVIWDNLSYTVFVVPKA